MSSQGSSSAQLLELAARIADGDPVDWAAESDSLEPELLARLRDVEALAGRCLFEPPPSPEPELMDPGSRFDRLQILEHIGTGAGGHVYRARDPLIGREVALKVCTPGAGRSAALLREAQQMARIDHPNVLRVHGAVELDGVVGFWSDLVRGESLDAWARTRSPLSAAEVSLIGIELCSALAAIHAQGMVHGDIKPGNVVRHASGRWVLLDFGSSCAMSDGTATSGTPLYLAPEVFAGGQATAASDIYALGVLLFRLATGRFPREADDLASLLEQHRAGKRLRLLDLRPELETAFVTAVETALEAQPAARHASAGELAHALGAAPAGATKSNPWLWAAAAVLAITLLLAALLLPTGPVAGAPEIALQRIVGDVEQPLRDGDEVRPGDGLALRYRNDRVAYVYVINEDGRGESYQLFPLAGSELANPLPAGQQIRLPGRVDGQDVDWQVTSRGGQERFYVVVSETPQPALIERGLVQSGSAEAALAAQSSLLAMSGETLRGAGGLRARSPAVAGDGSDLAKWLSDLDRAEGVYVERFALRNP